MSAELRKLRKALTTRRANLMEDTFTTPPADWAAFNRALGAFKEIDQQLAEVDNLLKAKEAENDDDV